MMDTSSQTLDVRQQYIADPLPGQPHLWTCPRLYPYYGKYDPGLHYRTLSMQVSQLGWDSSTHPVCHLAGGSLPVLGAALADRLLIARSSPRLSGRVDVSPRCVTLLQPLLTGWATLTATGFLPGACNCICSCNVLVIALVLAVV